MTEWEVLGIIIVLIGFVSSIVAPIIKLNTTITKLTQIVDSLATDVAELTKRNSDTHARLFDVINEHDKRISILEHDFGGTK